ncbi:hypothetical protein QN219_01635 [Sinorhizobium sp. 7-81]|uniref:hypothetical protein n=1 Tax=Sinorhizobium sp. 8-89 TaxID=3049089 RepID=UPI0024C2D44D|nr:hypothetical protein [Sinorhizobium sp. 8-89]MDK1488761.1 hypothetical protein [Sinorhizobium sp. 8-89]
METRERMSSKSAQRFWDDDMHGNKGAHVAQKVRSGFGMTTCMETRERMSPKSAQRFWGNDMHEDKDRLRVRDCE